MLLAGCSFAPPDLPPAERIDLAPAAATAVAEAPLGAAAAKPMYRELVPVDLATVVEVATARNLDVQRARERVEAQRAQLQSVAGWLFPTLAPTLLYEQVDGTVRATQGNLVDVAFHSVQPYVLAQWFLNPGKVAYEIVAARKRMVASQHQERSTLLQIIARAAIGYYDLVLAQATTAAAHSSVAEARELLRITQARVRTGAGLPGDELRARAQLAGYEEDLVQAVGAFHAASVALAQTLDLDPTVTLAPTATQVAQTTLVRADLAIDDLLGIALARRDDLAGVRELVAAAADATSAARWSALGPQVGAGFQYGGIAGHAEDVAALGGNREGLHEQLRFTAAASFELTLASLGQIAAAEVAERQAALAARHQLASVQAEVVRADQGSRTLAVVIGHSHDRLTAAEEALRLAQASLRAGTARPLDVMHDASQAAQARLRYAEAVVHYNQAQIDLLAALGVLCAESLRPRSSTQALNG